MKNKAYKCLGMVLQIAVPESVEEFDKNAGRTGACLDEGTNNVVYRSTLADIRAGIIDKLEETTGIERAAEKDKDGNIVRYTESELAYANRVFAETGKEASAYQDLGQSVADENKFDASATERKAPEPKALSKDYLAAAKQLREQGHGAQVAAALSKLLGIEVVDTEESLAKAISANEARKRAEARKKLTSDYASLIG